MDVRVATDALLSARVSAVHYGKNIAFTNYTTCSMVIRELALIDLGRRLDYRVLTTAMRVTPSATTPTATR